MSTVILAGCNSGSKSTKKKSSSSSQPDSSEVTPVNPAPPIDDHEGTPGEGEVADKHITGISMKYTKDFFMQNKTTLDFSVTFKGGGGDDEKGIDWKSSNEKVLLVEPNPDKTSQCVLTALKEGTSTLTARSQYNRSLTDEVTITVIDNSDYTYFWQIDKTGDNKNDANKFNGDDGRARSEGTVTLSGMEWNFKFDTPTKNVGGGQSLTFGSKADPYGNVEFSTENTRYIRKISVLCSSSAAHYNTGSGYGKSGDEGTSHITISVGNTKYVNDVATPKYSTDQPLDTVTGEEFNDKVLTGDIKIHFSPTYYDPETKVNSGAIYLKAIIIEYYRGDLQKIEVDSETSEQPTAFFKGTAFNTNGLVVNAFFSESPETKVDVTHLLNITTDNLGKDGKFINEAANQDVNLSYTYKKGSVIQTQKTSYPIVVYPELKSIQITGSLTEKHEYLIYDEIDYTGIKINLMADAEEPVLTYDLKDYKTAQFKETFSATNLHEYAIKALQNGYTITLKHNLTGKSSTFAFKKNDLIVKQVADIAVFYKDGETLYNPSLTEGEKIDYSEFNAKITYDDESSETFKFSQLSSQTYLDPNNSNKKTPRYDYASYSPLVVSKSMQTEGFSVSVKCDLDNKVGTLEIPADQVSVKAIQSVQIVCNSLSKTDYDEHDLMDYTGVQVVITYDDSTSLTLSYAEALEFDIYIQEDNKVKATPLFNFDFPNEATMDMMNNGFTLSVTTSIGELENELEVNANTIHVKPYVAKTYTKVKSNADFDAEGYYIITCIDRDDTTKTRVWNGALSNENNEIWNTRTNEREGNYFDYQHSTNIGDTLTIYDAKVERAAFYIKKLDEQVELSDGTKINPIAIYLASTVGTSSELKLTVNKDAPSFKKTADKKQKLITIQEKDDYDSIQIGYNDNTYQKYVYYNTGGKRFYTYKQGNQSLPIQVYKVNL